MNILVLGNGAREHALVWKLSQNKLVSLYNYGPTTNPGIKELVTEIEIGDPTEVAAVVEYAQTKKIDMVWVGPEAPLAVGIVDALEGMGIACIGPTKKLARLESSKSFTRDLLKKYEIEASPKYHIYTSMEGVEEFMRILDGNIVVKPDGLTGGKGVKVMGDHFNSIKEALAYCEELFQHPGTKVVIEEKLVGQEFSLMSFSDGNTLVHMPVVQDHKRAYENDEGPNTGGMGSYTDTDHSMPFLNASDIKHAQKINERTLQAIKEEFDEEYKGIMYGGFIALADGVRLIEYNARFGDPEAMNLLSLLETDLVDITKAIAERSLDQLDVKFSQQASVCKYVVPEGYPDKPVKNKIINADQVNKSQVNLFYASVDQTNDGLIEKGSRTIAVVGLADTIAEAEQKVEAEIEKITGPLFHRPDIGTSALIEKRIQMMKQLRHEEN